MPKPHARRGFTLVEVLVTIGIIVLLISILLPMIISSIRTSERTKLKGDLNAIAMALEAYKQDFGELSPRSCRRSEHDPR